MDMLVYFTHLVKQVSKVYWYKDTPMLAKKHMYLSSNVERIYNVTIKTERWILEVTWKTYLGHPTLPLHNTEQCALDLATQHVDPYGEDGQLFSLSERIKHNIYKLLGSCVDNTTLRDVEDITLYNVLWHFLQSLYDYITYFVAYLSRKYIFYTLFK